MNSLPFTSERDGYDWLQVLERDPVYYNKWAYNLAQAEITGYYSYAAVIKVLLNSLPQWKGLNMENFIKHACIIKAQEYLHSKIVLNHLSVSAPPVSHEKTFSELDINERRSEMRLRTILTYSNNPKLIDLANKLIIDEAYHCWYTQHVLSELGDFDL